MQMFTTTPPVIVIQKEKSSLRDMKIRHKLQEKVTALSSLHQAATFLFSPYGDNHGLSVDDDRVSAISLAIGSGRFATFCQWRQ